MLYQSFDSSDGFVLMEGTEAASNSVPLVSGKVGYIKFVFRKLMGEKSKTTSKTQSMKIFKPLLSPFTPLNHIFVVV